MIPSVLSHRKAATLAVDDDKCDAGDVQAFPNLCTLLEGVRGKASGTWDCPRYKLLIWLDSGRIKASLMAGDEHEKWWGTLSTLVDLLERLEELLEGGKGEWRKAKDQNPSSHNGKK